MEWFRMYHEFATDPKVQSMPEAMQRRLMMLLCLRCSNTLVTLQETEIAFAMRISDEELAETKVLFLRKKFIDEDWEVLQWDKRQFVSDSSAPRVARHRAKVKALAETAQQQNCNVTVTPQIQNRTDTEQIQNKTEKAKASAAPKYSALADLLENGVDLQIANDWLAVRKAKKLADTKTAIAGVLREIAKADMTPDAGLRICCERGWAGFSPEWLRQPSRASPAQPASRHSGFEKLNYTEGIEDGRIT